MAACTICGNAGVVERDGKLLECECSELRRIAASMPSYIRTAKVQEAHLKTLVDGKTRLIESVDRSLYITAYWNDMRAFIKVVMLKHRNKFLRIISDRELRDVFVGSASRSARGEDSKEAVYNSIEDLVKSPALLIIRLNELKYKNKAASSVLEEAMCYRLDRNQPIWLLNNPLDRFVRGSVAWSETVESLCSSILHVRVDQINQVDGFMEPRPVNSVADSPLAPEQAAPSRSTSPKSTSKKTVRSAPDEEEEELPSGLGAFGRGIKPGRRL
jgi:hypothetical protein